MIGIDVAMTDILGDPEVTANHATFPIWIRKTTVQFAVTVTVKYHVMMRKLVIGHNGFSDIVRTDMTQLYESIIKTWHLPTLN